MGSDPWNILSSPLRLVPISGLFSRVPCDEFRPLEYALRAAGGDLGYAGRQRRGPAGGAGGVQARGRAAHAGGHGIGEALPRGGHGVHAGEGVSEGLNEGVSEGLGEGLSVTGVSEGVNVAVSEGVREGVRGVQMCRTCWQTWHGGSPRQGRAMYCKSTVVVNCVTGVPAGTFASLAYGSTPAPLLQ
eukprot:1006072-Prorocentrum_minimum.AAC.1